MFEVLTLECNLQNVGIFRVVRYLVGCKILENLFFGSPSEKFDNPCSNSLKVLRRDFLNGEESTVKLGYNKELGTGQICSL